MGAGTGEHASWEAYREVERPERVYAFSTRGTRSYADVAYRPGDTSLFGPETRGLPVDLREGLGTDHAPRPPMVPGSGSLNLSNAVAVVA